MNAPIVTFGPRKTTMDEPTLTLDDGAVWSRLQGAALPLPATDSTLIGTSQGRSPMDDITLTLDDGATCKVLQFFGERRALVDIYGAFVMVDKRLEDDVWEESGEPARAAEMEALKRFLAPTLDRTVVTVTGGSRLQGAALPLDAKE